MSKRKADRFDVVIVEIATNKIASIIGSDLDERQAERRAEMMFRGR
jgi:hypothetical protein